MSKRVFVRGLNRATSSATLREAFTECGNVLDASVAFDHEGRSRGYGFVTFERREGAQRALALKDTVTVDGSTMSVQNLSSALPKAASW